MPKRYLIAATPAIAAIAIGWLIPLAVYGHFPIVADGGSRVLDGDGICCVEPTSYYIARMVAFFSPLAVTASGLAILTIKFLSKRR